MLDLPLVGLSGRDDANRAIPWRIDHDEEPTFDLAHQLEVIQLVRRLAHELGLGVIIVIHDINLAAQYCDRLIAIKQGRLLYDETPAALMTQEKLHDIYGVALSLLPHPLNQHTVALL